VGAQLQAVMIDGQWREARWTGTFRAVNPSTSQPLPPEYPVSGWEDCDAALGAAAAAHEAIKRLADEPRAAFLERFAERIEKRAGELVETAHAETGLPKTPRLAEVELPRTTAQLRKAAEAARDGSWRMATIDRAANIRSAYASIGPVCVFGPNNFPFAFGSASGGDFAAAIAAGNPVIAKANTSHPGTTRVFAEEAHAAAGETGLPPATVQLLYRTSHADGARLVADPRTGATGYTGSRAAGLALKAAADAAGKPIYLELSSVNPVVVLPGAIEERGEKIVEEYATSCLMGSGQFCTNPGLVVLIQGAATERFAELAVQKFQSAPAGTLLSKNVNDSLSANVQKLTKAGAAVVLGGESCSGERFCFQNTLLRITGKQFLADPHLWQTEMFGNASLWVVADDVDEAARLFDHLEGNLTGCIYSDTRGKDDAAYDRVAPRLRPRVGRLLNDKMPTGVAVSPAMNHGGPYPATGHPGFTAVGLPAAMLRFAALECYDNVRPARLPVWLRDKNPTGRTWRLVDGAWSQGDA
jgi:NADP-dependent aldehyde dehydrogenase